MIMWNTNDYEWITIYCNNNTTNTNEHATMIMWKRSYKVREKRAKSLRGRSQKV